jgi:hypothetical protein
MSVELTPEPAAEPYDDLPWTPAEMAALAAEAFGKLDDTDYSHYLSNGPPFKSKVDAWHD